MTLWNRSPSARGVTSHNSALARGRPERFRSYGWPGWWKADVGTHIDTGVDSWANQTGTVNAFVQATGAKQPTLSATGGPFGRPCLVGDGTDDTIKATFTLTKPWTVFIVCKWNVAFAAAEDVLDGGAAGDIHFFRNSSTQVTHWGGADVGTTTPQAWHCYALGNNAGTGTIDADGVQIGTAARADISPAGLQAFTYGDAATNPANASVAEIIAYAGTVLSGSAKLMVFNYLRARHGT